MAYFGLDIRDSQGSTAAQISKATGGISPRPAKTHVANLKCENVAAHRKLAVTQK